jgi:putative restriction endonuclease
MRITTRLDLFIGVAMAVDLSKCRRSEAAVEDKGSPEQFHICAKWLGKKHLTLEELPGNRLSFTADLVLRFQSYWKVVVSRWLSKPDLRLPFHHLSSQGFWEPLTNELKPSKHRSLTESVEMVPSFFAAMKDREFLRCARAVLISHYFPPFEQIALRTLTGIDDKHSETDAQLIREEAREYARHTARDARFRIQVVSAYLFTCARTGYRLTTLSGSSIVDAAHIHERSDCQNDDPQNGLALSKNAHWMFDEGLWSLTDDFKILVAPMAAS